MTIYNDDLEAYVRKMFPPPDEVFERIQDRIEEHGLPSITIRPEEGRFLQFLVAAVRARKVLELGTLGGYSGTWLAKGLPEGGRLITVELSEFNAMVAGESFHDAEVAEKVEIRIGDAYELLPSLSLEGPFDLIFIDANKERYPDYLSWAATNLCSGGIVVAHNAFRRGDILRATPELTGTVEVKEFLRCLAEDPRWLSTMYPGGDGIALGYLRET